MSKILRVVASASLALLFFPNSNAWAEAFTVTFDFTSAGNYSDDPGLPGSEQWVAGSSDNGNVTPGNFFGRHWDLSYLQFNGSRGLVADSNIPAGIGQTQIFGGDQDAPPPAPYFSWALDIGAGYQIDNFSASMDGNSSVGSALTPTNNWMGTNSGVEPIILPTFSDSNFDFTAASTLSLAHTGTLTTNFYTGGTVGYQFDTLTITGNISAVPEPSSNILFLVGLALGVRRRRP